MNSIPQNRLLAYLFALGLIPLLVVFYIHLSESSELYKLEQRIDAIQLTLHLDDGKHSRNAATRLQHENSDPLFIDSELESLSFLGDEIKNLKAITQDPSFPDTPAIKKRLDFLAGPNNRLVFTEDLIQSSPHSKETLEVMRHPVEVDIDDLYKILATVENVSIGPYSPQPNSPQLIITDFKLERKKYPNKNEVFVLNIKLLKREFL
ncbi:MAG: hypothetical protein ACI9S8_000054 [Chlamydiales bacterium]|jgi:hypothetical protein